MKKLIVLTFALFLFACEKMASEPPKTILEGATLNFSRELIDGYDAMEKALIEDTKKAGGKVDTSLFLKPMPFKQHTVIYRVYKEDGKTLLIEGELSMVQTDHYQTPLNVLLNVHHNLKDYVKPIGQLYFHGFKLEKIQDNIPRYEMVLSRK